jgi:ferredoxin/flavodoxin
MEVKQVKLIYFSATGTTQKVLDSIADGLAAKDVEHINLTLPDNANRANSAFSDELVFIGAPVYGGRLPVDAINRFKQLKASKNLAVLIVVYGNREFEDALLELKNLAIELGFHPIAGGAFIGEHSYSTKDVPIASGRPDQADIHKARAFGVIIKEKLNELQSPEDVTDLVVPGSFPYEAAGARKMTVSPVTLADKCTVCGTCAGVCPTSAITVGETVATEIEACIRCCACIKSCPEDARIFEDDMMNTIAGWLHENCAARKEPQLFGVEV